MKKIVKLYIKENTTIEVLFNDGITKRYDCLSLADMYPKLNDLKNRDLFLTAKILGNSGIYWNDDLDLEGETIYHDGEIVQNSEPTINIILGFRFKEERIKKGLSQKEVSLISGIDQGDLSKIENGSANPTLLTISKLSKCLNKEINISLN